LRHRGPFLAALLFDLMPDGRRFLLLFRR